jgi:hypothetical protein
MRKLTLGKCALQAIAKCYQAFWKEELRVGLTHTDEKLLAIGDACLLLQGGRTTQIAGCCHASKVSSDTAEERSDR